MLQSMGLQRVGHDLATEQQLTFKNLFILFYFHRNDESHWKVHSGIVPGMSR